MASRECGLSGCDRPFYAKDLCRFHYDRQRLGRPLDAPYQELSNRGRGPKPYFDWAACGTSSQYQKHLRHKIPVCDACRRAEYERTSKWRRDNNDRYNACRRARWAENPEHYRRKLRDYRACRT